MKKYLLMVIFLIPPSYAKSKHELERINFYPRVKAYIQAGYSYQLNIITTPREEIDDEIIRNYRNLFHLEYAWKFPWFFLGARIGYAVVSESAANYGIASKKRYESQDFTEPTIFAFSRLREQKDEKGNIDLGFAFSDNYGTKEVGESSSNRLEGRNIYHTSISHGYLEEDWEFKNSLLFQFYDEGTEANSFTDQAYNLGPYNIFTYLFTGQYTLKERVFSYASIGVEYRTSQKIKSGDDKREIQQGTGSIFQVGIKRSFNDWAVAELGYEYKRSSYFVHGKSENFDGDASQHRFLVSFKYGF